MQSCTTLEGFKDIKPYLINQLLFWQSSVILHELGHAIGFQHEQCRNDRDNYITVYLENVASNMRYNYNKLNTDNRNIRYDYTSIMHYGEKVKCSNISYSFSNVIMVDEKYDLIPLIFELLL